MGRIEPSTCKILSQQRAVYKQDHWNALSPPVESSTHIHGVITEFTSPSQAYSWNSSLFQIPGHRRYLSQAPVAFQIALRAWLSPHWALHQVCTLQNDRKFGWWGSPMNISGHIFILSLLCSLSVLLVLTACFFTYSSTQSLSSILLHVNPTCPIPASIQPYKVANQQRVLGYDAVDQLSRVVVPWTHTSGSLAHQSFIPPHIHAHLCIEVGMLSRTCSMAPTIASVSLYTSAL